MKTVSLLLGLFILYLSKRESDQCGIGPNSTSSYSVKPEFYDYKINIVKNGI
jgi:hypothetical protein